MVRCQVVRCQGKALAPGLGAAHLFSRPAWNPSLRTTALRAVAGSGEFGCSDTWHLTTWHLEFFMEVSLAHLDQFLTNYSIVYRNQDFVGGRLFPDFPVSKQNDRYPIFGFERFKAYNTERAPGSEANEMPGWRMSNDEYYCDGKAQKQLIPDELRAKWDFSTGPEVFTTETLADIIDKQREIQIYNLIMNSATVPSTTLAGTGQWSDFQNSDPVAAITAQRSTILLSCTKEPNTLLVGYPVWLQLIQHPIILDRFKNHALPLGYPTDQQLAGLFNVDNFVVAKALYDTSQQGIAHNLNYIWGKNAILAYVPPGQGQLMITPGTTFRWLYGVPQNGGMLVKRYRVEERSGDMIEYQTYYCVKLVVPGAMYVFKSAVA